MADFADASGALGPEREGVRARLTLEHAAGGVQAPVPIVLNFGGVRALTLEFAQAFFEPLLAESRPGYYGNRPLIVANATGDVRDALMRLGAWPAAVPAAD